MENNNSGLLIAALVAIVAVVGLVILFKGGATGNAICPPGQIAAQVNNYGGQGQVTCVDQAQNYRTIPDQVAEPRYAPGDDTFFTKYENDDRRYQIAQRTWEY